jgi:prevent-host-death family protein
MIRLVKSTSQLEEHMREVQSSVAKARLPQFLDEVERGETIVITRHGRAIAHLVPAPMGDRDRVRRALDGISALRQSTGRLSLDELLEFRHEGHKY